VEFFHLTFASDGRMPLFAREPERRAGVRALVRTAARQLALFCLADDHVHAVTEGNRAATGHLGRALRAALSNAAGVPIDAARIRRVESRSHAEWLARNYIVAQPTKHGLRDDPALYSGSCFQDLVGARHIVELRIGDLLPRFRIEDVLQTLGLPAKRVSPVGKDTIRRLGVARVADAAASAVALGTLDGMTVRTVRARRTVVQLCDRAEIARREIAHALALSPRSVRLIASGELDVELARAVCVRLAIEELRANR
jgi:hypothetical protein